MLLLANSERDATSLNIVSDDDSPTLCSLDKPPSLSLSLAIVRGCLCVSDESEKCQVVRWSPDCKKILKLEKLLRPQYLGSVHIKAQKRLGASLLVNGGIKTFFDQISGGVNSLFHYTWLLNYILEIDVNSCRDFHQ